MNRAEFCRYQEETFDAFCKRIIHNTAIDEKKKAEVRERRECSLSEIPEDAFAVPPVELQQGAPASSFLVYGMLVSVQDQRIAAALCQIPSNLREVLLLYYYCDFTMVQIAALTNLPLSTVDYRHKQALRRLRKNLEAADEA